MPASLLRQGRKQLIERGVEGRERVGLQLLGYRVYVEAKGRRPLQCSVRGSWLGSERDLNTPVIAKRIHRGRWNGRDRIRSDQGFEVHHVGVRRILGSRAGPQR